MLNSTESKYCIAYFSLVKCLYFYSISRLHYLRQCLKFKKNINVLALV